MNTPWQGTWNTSRGELRFHQKGNRVYGDYAHVGLIEAIYNPETKVLQGTYVVGTQGQINFTLNENRFTGEATWDQNGELQRVDWTGEKQSDELPELISYAAIGTWETNRGTLKLRQEGINITGTLGESKTLTGTYTFNAATETTEPFRSIEGKLTDQNSEEDFSIKIEKTASGEWRFTEIVPPSNSQERQPWQGRRISDEEPDLRNLEETGTLQKVIAPIQHGDQGAAVANLQMALEALDFPIEDLQEEQTQRYGSSTGEAVSNFKDRYELSNLEPDRFGQEAADKINELLAEWGLLEEETGAPSDRFVVRGRIIGSDRLPLTNAVVSAFDKDLRNEQRLGATQTDTNGNYEITYSPSQFQRAEKLQADLFIQVLNDAGDILAASSVVFHAQPLETINLSITIDHAHGPSEFERLIAKLTPLLDGLNFSELTEDAEHQDITFLSGETGQDPDHIEFLVVAFRHSEATDISAEIFYGLFRQGVPTDLADLEAQTSERLRTALITSFRANLIPVSLEPQLDEILDRLAETDFEQPTFLAQPEVLFHAPSSLDSSNSTLQTSIRKRLNQEFHHQVIQTIGKTSQPLRLAVQKAVAQANYTSFQEDTLAEAASKLLSDVQDQQLADEAKAVMSRLSNNTSSNIKEALQIDVPIGQNTHFASEIRRAKLASYADLIRLNRLATKQLLKTNLLVDDDAAALSELVDRNILTVQQRDDLKFTLDLGRLTNDNLPLVQNLREMETSIQQLVQWEQTQWQSLIEEEGFSVPVGETAQTYAETIRFNLEKTYPTQALLTRLPATAVAVNRLDNLNNLLETRDHLVREGIPTPLDIIDIDEDQQQGLTELVELANTYQHLGVAELVNNKQLPLGEKKQVIANRVQLIETFYENNAEVDLRFVDFFDTSHEQLDWNNIPSDEQPQVRKQLMAYQRTLLLAEETAERQMLLRRGYDSALAIANQIEAQFVKNVGLELGKARMIYAQAQTTAITSIHQFEAIRDTTLGQFKDLAVSNLNSSFVNDLRDLDGFEELFGPQSYCYCEHCRSILSPAAYFVDLMYFVDQHVSISTFIQPQRTEDSLYLAQRRGDLWQLKLTCEHTHTLLPYLTIVNEVLETYLDNVVDGDIYETLSYQNSDTEKISFGLPFILPLEELRLYLNHFELKLHDIYRFLKEPEHKIWRTQLNLSPSEFAVITVPDHASSTYRFGKPNSLENFPIEHNSDDGIDRRGFIHIAGISREQLDELLAITFNSNLGNIKIDKKANENELLYFPEILKNLTNEHLDFIHRFLRLWQKTSFTIPEFDLILSALKEADLATTSIDESAVLHLSQLIGLQKEYDFHVEELCGLVHQLPVSEAFPQIPEDEENLRFFERRFDSRKLFYGQTEITFHHYSLNQDNSQDREIDTRTPILLGGLGISETELLLLFELLKDEMPFNADGDCILNIDKISLLYRHARLAKALRFSISDLIEALKLNFSEIDAPITTLTQIHHLKTFRDWLRESSFDISTLRFILRGEESDRVIYTTTTEVVAELVWEIQQDGERIQQTTLPEKTKILEMSLARHFNLSSDQLALTLAWISIDINSTGIQTAINTGFTENETNSSETEDVSNKPEPLNPSELMPLIELMRKIERIQLIFNTLALKENTLSYITRQSEALGISDLSSLTLNNLKSLTTYKQSIASRDEAEQWVQLSLDRYLTNATFTGESVSELAALWKQEVSLVKSLIETLSFSSVPIDALEHLREGLLLCQTLGINGYSLQKLAQDHSYEVLEIARDIALGAFSSKYDDEQLRQEKLEPYQDKINIIKRDSLCDYIIARQQDLNFKDFNDIYAFFLLDVEMSGCFRISRLVAAISSLQLYIHRILVNLEQSGSTSLNVLNEVLDLEDFKREWEWRKNYRVWEANRKVFLYPENYIEPDLLDHKSSIFKELEDELLQEKISFESAEASYRKYFSQFTSLAHLRIAGSYYHRDTDTYYFFGRTQEDPPQYYYRKWTKEIIWTPWEKIGLAINASEVTAIIHLGKLYVFWIEGRAQKSSKVRDGNTESTGFDHFYDLLFSFIDKKNQWISPQRMTNLIKLGGKRNGNLSSFQCFPEIDLDNRLFVFFIDSVATSNKLKSVEISLFKNELISSKGSFSSPGIYLQNQLIRLLSEEYEKIYNERKFGRKHLKIYRLATELSYRHFRHEAAVDNEISNEVTIVVDHHGYEISKESKKNYKFLTEEYPEHKLTFKLDCVGQTFHDFILHAGQQQYLITINANERFLIQLSTSLSDELGEILFTQGLEDFLSLTTQQNTELPFPARIINLDELPLPAVNQNHIDFQGAYGLYYRELFFHIPFLIANHCNANQKFKEAKWWYERIFDPTSSESSNAEKPKDRNWRYIEFRNLTLQKMKEVLSDQAAIAQYEEDPFNPHAIARLRLGAYQKAIVMKYIDNLLDWGDDLFAQDTIESINEATMLYVLAQDILGRRPIKQGKCKTAKDNELTYARIGPRIQKGSPILIELENWSWVSLAKRKASQILRPLHTTENNIALQDISSINLMQFSPSPRLGKFIGATEQKQRYRDSIKAWGDNSNTKASAYKAYRRKLRNPRIQAVKQSSLAFCVPPNQDLLAYWDRVEDRLFKIRNCMNISGVRRQLALFQPPIDPRLLVRAKAAGLSLEDILGMMSAPLPPYRFSYLVEKAKQFTQTVQSFGAALLSALEKKDGEALALLRSVHERNILRMTKEIKKQQLKEAQHQYQAIVETGTNVQNRINYYQSLMEEGLNTWEAVQQVSKHISTIIKLTESVVHLQAGITYLVPQVGSPFSMKYGGQELGNSGVEFAQWASSIAAIADAVSASAGLEAGFQRREQEWEQQLLLAQQELKQIETQQLAAEVRTLIAEKDLEIHGKNIEQTNELHAFYKDKFTNLGLYNYLSTSLNRLYREAYNIAHDMAMMTQKSYQFERDDNTFFIANDNWQYDKSGLLAGERLLLQLQRMEKNYLEQHRREHEITQSISLALASPESLMILKETGSCSFSVPEILFDLAYPGQYKRLIKSVRITIPCVTGAYTSVSAKLTLEKSEIREEANLDSPLEELLIAKNTSITTSSAQNDSGMFDLNFRDERYLPFEGAGIISTWRLELPSAVRLFNYNTISDVLIHLSYTAKDDGVLREKVEAKIQNTLLNFASNEGLYRLFSLRRDFTNAFHNLLHTSVNTSSTNQVQFEIGNQHFPYFLNSFELNMSEVRLYLKPKGLQAVNTSSMTFSVNDINIDAWEPFGENTNLKEGTISISGSPYRTWTIKSERLDLVQEEIDDIIILVKYQTSGD